MPSFYEVVILNETGGPQDYAFFSGTPNVSGGISGPTLTNVIATAHHTPDSSSASFSMGTTFFAICGSYQGTLESGGTSIISKTVPVTLGSRSEGDIIIKGSTVSLSVFDKSSCDLGPPTTPGGGKLGCFEISTVVDNDVNAFTFKDAVSNNLLIGIANSKDNSILNAMGTFTPFPNTAYQIQPSSTVWVAAGQKLEDGAFIKVEELSNTMAVDFNIRGHNRVKILHDVNNRFVFMME